ncbi:MAG: RNA-binding cell elongation regulator Jag/EloR [Acidimicrobiia bacterium]
MEWIEVSARTLDEATELALDRLGVVADELEYEVIDEPRGGLFGIGRTEARIRARVKPLSREKPAERRRRRGSERRPSGGSRKPRADSPSPRAAARPVPADDEAETSERPAAPSRSTSSRSRSRRRGRSGGGTDAGTPNERTPRSGNDDRPEAKVNVDTDAEDVDIEVQAEQAASFTRTLVDAMGLSGKVSARVDDDTVLVAVDGEGLGLLVGPRGSTLQAIEELVRAVVQHGLSGRSARLRVDVGGYRERRREALAAFARQVAEEVRDGGVERGLEPMSAPDRKVVHDTVADIEGVATSSEGEEPRRRVVISPA